MRKLLVILCCAAMIAAIAVIAMLVTRPEAEITYAAYDFSLSNVDIARTVIGHVRSSVESDARAPENTDLAAVVISGPALIYEADNAAEKLTCTQARYYYRFATGEVGRVDIRVREKNDEQNSGLLWNPGSIEGQIASSGSGIHPRYAKAEGKPHVLIVNDFYGEFAAFSSGARRIGDAALDRADFPEESFVSGFTMQRLVRRYAKVLAAHTSATVPMEAMTLAELEEDAALAIETAQYDYSLDNPAIAAEIVAAAARETAIDWAGASVSGPYVRWFVNDERNGVVEAENEYQYTMYYHLHTKSGQVYALRWSETPFGSVHPNGLFDGDYLSLVGVPHCVFGSIYYALYIITEEEVKPVEEFIPFPYTYKAPYEIGIAARTFAKELLDASPEAQTRTLSELEAVAG